MQRLAASALVAFSLLIAVSSRELSCQSALRGHARFAKFFRHCETTYSQNSDSKVEIPTAASPSPITEPPRRLGSEDEPCSSLEGPELAQGQVWVSQHCSILRIHFFDSESGLFNGSYQNLAGEAKRPYPITGYKNPQGHTIGFTFGWRKRISELFSTCAVSSYSGNMRFLPNGGSVIHTSFLFSPESRFLGSTEIGFEDFYPAESATLVCPRRY